MAANAQGDTRRVALITGITGQDGSYLAELLLEKHYIVHGIIRRSSSFNTGRIEHIMGKPDIHLHYGDMTDSVSILHLVNSIKPDEIYNLAAQSHVMVSFELPEYTADSDGIGVLRILEAVRLSGRLKETKLYQASTSEMYGLVQETPQSETTPFYPRSPYGCAKLYSYWIARNYRESYDMFVSNGILFNHESPRRGGTFVTRKITRALARIKTGVLDSVVLGNMDSLRDWGHARDFVEAMWLILQEEKPDDFVIATGEQHTVREFLEEAFTYIGKTISWSNSGVDEVGIDEDGIVRVNINERYFRPAEVQSLLGNYTKAKKILKWEPKITFKKLVKEMMEHDIAEAEQELIVIRSKTSVDPAQL